MLVSQADEEKQRPSSNRAHEGSSDSALVLLRAMQRRSDLHAVELVLNPEERFGIAVMGSIIFHLFLFLS